MGREAGAGQRRHGEGSGREIETGREKGRGRHISIFRKIERRARGREMKRAMDVTS